jgi:methenyltetrahydromethanopterin cyclohydrolase
MGSGPARALSAHEALFHDIPHKEQASRAVLVLEGDAPPGETAARDMAKACRLPRNRLTLLHAPTGSLAGTVQIAARVIECALQKARALHVDLGIIAEALGTAPLAPPHPDTLTAMGRANDAIIYGGRVHLFITGGAKAAKALAEALPSQTAPDWGRSFSEVFVEAEGDFARIDPALFSPAEVLVTALATGDTFRAGRPDPARIAAILGVP